MSAITNLFSTLAEPLGWTLVNSLWQALGVLLVVVIALRIVPSRLSSVRYAIACSGMLAVILINLATLIFLLPTGEVLEHAGMMNNPTVQQFTFPSTPSPLVGFWNNLLLTVESNMSLILLGWLGGAVFFCLRLMSSWWYISKLKSESLILDNEWSRHLQTLAQQLGINRMVTLAQTARIQTPIVIGYIKPVVLVPAGLLTGLSAEQIETIFVHELAHIRRHDYIINVLQSFIEAFYFFNPFLWIISSIIRTEREYCCDDTVISKHGGSLAYAHALAHLEELRLSRTEFGLSLAENKNQLLNRIKRIMEKSAKNYSGKDRIVPALLLVVGLICASWLTIQTDHGKYNAKAKIVSGDTTRPRQEKPDAYSKTTIITIDEHGNAHEETIENFEGDEDVTWKMPLAVFDPLMTPDAPYPFGGMPAIPAFPDAVDAIPFQSFGWKRDSIPVERFGFRQREDWKEFSEEFEKKFKTEFGDFFKSHEKDFDKMMKELEANFEANFGDRQWQEMDQVWAMADLERLQEGLQVLSGKDMERIEVEALRAQEMSEHMQEWAEDHRETFEKMARDMDAQGLQFKEMESEMKGMEERMSRFETELKKELVRDGYIGKDEKISRMQWDDNGEIEINGKKIKESDHQKYNEIHRKYFKSSGNFSYSE